MPRRIVNEEELSAVMARWQSVSQGAHAHDEKVALLQSIRNDYPGLSVRLDRTLLDETHRLRDDLLTLREAQAHLKAIIEKLTAPPYFPAIFRGGQVTGRGYEALVQQGSTRRVVAVAEGVDVTAFRIGAELLLSAEMNVVMESSCFPAGRTGETAIFDRYAGPDRLILRVRDEELMVEAADDLREVELSNGDLVRWDRQQMLALERLAPPQGDDRFLEETPAETFAQIGGLDEQIVRLRRIIAFRFHHGELARKYHLPQAGSILLIGPPGTGKTMLARAIANYLAQLSSSGRARFINVRPAELNSMWFSQSERNYRELFAAARRAGEAEPDVPVVIFFDELDAIGQARGQSLMRVDNSVVTALAAELDGIEARGNIIVIGATNRHDALDPALYRGGRFKDCVINVPRPGMKAARAIFDRHLPVDIPCAGTGSDQAARRQALLNAALSHIYAPNAETELATITFRDGKRRSVNAADLINGAGIASICRVAIERACVREAETGEEGLRTEDMLAAIAEEFDSLSGVLTPANCHLYLSDLPQDVGVVSVEPVRRRVRHTYRYLNAA